MWVRGQSHERFDDQRGVLGDLEVGDPVLHEILNLLRRRVLQGEGLNRHDLVLAEKLDAVHGVVHYSSLFSVRVEVDQNDVDLVLHEQFSYVVQVEVVV